jgi:CubicO group peptidase (beta-lactamase class C family)
MVVVGGDTTSGWERAADTFKANFSEHGELGAACAVYADGKKVVDVWGGVADSRTGRPWVEDTVALVFSTTKGATAICAHMLAERGQLDLDAPVVTYWPEYGTNGKELTLVRWFLSHQAGVPAVDAELSLEEMCAWEPVIQALEAQQPFWVPGEQHLYHALTYGFLVGEVVRRVSGRSLGTFFGEEVAQPLRLDAWIGTSAEVEPRVAHLVMDPPPADAEATLREFFAKLGLNGQSIDTMTAAMKDAEEDPSSVAARSINLGGALPDGLVTDEGGHNSRIVRAAEVPGSNMVADARSIAHMYAATIGEVDGVRLLQPETVEIASVNQTAGIPAYGQPPGLEEFDEAIGGGIGLGFTLPSRLMPLLGPRSFGHPGAGGSVGFADPDTGIAFAYVMNRMSSDINDSRAIRLTDAVRSCLEA